MIYADFNATTPLGNASSNTMERAMELWGNPSSTHQMGRQANELVENARRLVAEQAGVKPTEIVFTSGGSEANTLALLGTAWASKEPLRLLTSKVEHSSVRDSGSLLQKLGNIVEFVKLLPSGDLDWEHFERTLAEFHPTLVSLMTANNETGILFPIPKITELCAEKGIRFHTDAVQAFGKTHPTYWNRADLISISAHKIHGPKGVGALLVKGGVKLVPTHYGGSQEIKRRGGTENVIGIAGFGGACSELPGETKCLEIEKLRDRFEARLKELPGVHFQGGRTQRIPNTSNARFEGIPSEVLLSALDLDGICVSAGSACSSGSISPSHVLLEMGLSADEAKECIRFSWGRTTTVEEVDTTAETVIRHVNRIRTRRKV